MNKCTIEIKKEYRICWADSNDNHQAYYFLDNNTPIESIAEGVIELAKKDNIIVNGTPGYDTFINKITAALKNSQNRTTFSERFYLGQNKPVHFFKETNKYVNVY